MAGATITFSASTKVGLPGGWDGIRKGELTEPAADAWCGDHAKFAFSNGEWRKRGRGYSVIMTMDAAKAALWADELDDWADEMVEFASQPDPAEIAAARRAAKAIRSLTGTTRKPIF